jgi:colicin import membrane protein
MIRDKHNIIPVIMAGALHALMIASMFVVFEWSRPQRPRVPLAITATLVSEADIPQVVREPEPEPEPVVAEPEPEPEPEPPPVDTAAEERAAAEEQKRLDDQRVERERIRQEKAADERRKQQEATERKKREEAEQERRLQEAERKRLEDIERQRAENEQRRRDAENAEEERILLAAMQEEQNRLDAMNSDAMTRYMFALQQKIQRNWIRPASARPGLECVIDVRQSPSGEVLSASISRCDGDDAVRRSIEAAVYKASPLPAPANRYLFSRDLQIVFKPEQ